MWIVASVMVTISAGSSFGLAEIGGVAFDVENHFAGIVSYHRIGVCITIIEQLCDCFNNGSSGVGLLG